MTPIKLTAESVAAGLREHHGNMARVASAHGVTRQAVWEFINKRPSLKLVKTETKETMKDDAESALHAALLAGEAWAVCFFLKTQAKDRGYIEKTEVDHTGLPPVTVVRVPTLREPAHAERNGTH